MNARRSPCLRRIRKSRAGSRRNRATTRSLLTWWTVFGDPLLNALEEQVVVSNQSLAQAEAQYRQAQALVRGRGQAYIPLYPLPHRRAGPGLREAPAAGGRIRSINFSFPSSPIGKLTSGDACGARLSRARRAPRHPPPICRRCGFPCRPRWHKIISCSA